MSGATISSIRSGQKAPVFSVKKAGFVIPKNKLAGSLVPVFRGAKKPGSSDAFSGNETTKHVSRHTKWGPDLAQDPAVRKARALAYQTRADQITRQLKSGISENRDADEFEITAQSPDHESPGHEVGIKTQNSEQLELEKREAIGEILKLNPSNKAPPDYTPVLKEDRVSIPVKEYPGYNFVGLIFGPGGDNQKHLEKETGAKIQVFGSTRESRKRVEILPSESNDFPKAYDELYVRILADTFEKVDAAISVIELLITSVAGNLAMNDDDHVPSSQDVTPSIRFSHNSSMLPESTQTHPLGQPGYPNNWFPNEQPPYPRPPISSPMPLNNATHLSTPPLRPPSNTTPMFGFPQVPTVSVGFNMNPQNPSFVSANSNPPPQVLQHPPYVAQAQTNPVSVGPPPSNPSNISGPMMGISRPMMPPLPQPNVMPMAPNHGPSNIVAPTLLNTSHIGHLPPMLASSTLSPPVPFIGNALGSMQLPLTSLPMSVSGSTVNFTHLRPQLPTAPSSDNFAFHHHGPQNPAMQTIPRPHGNPYMTLNAIMPANPMHQTPSPRPPSSQLHLPNFTPQPPNHGFPRPNLAGNNMGQPQTHIPAAAAAMPFVRNPIRLPGHLGLQAFPDESSLQRNFGPTPQGPFFPGLGPGNHVPLPRFNNNLGFAPGRPVSTPIEQLYDPFSPTSMSVTPRQQGGMWRR